MRHQLLLVLLSILLLCVCSTYSVQGQSPIILGGEITYMCNGSDSYTVNTNVITDCKGADLPDSIIVDWSSTCLGGVSGTVTLSKVTGPVDITPGGNSYCNGGAGAIGIHSYLYSNTLTIPAGCSNFVLEWSTCCHSDSLVSITNPGTTPFYIKTELSNVTNWCNSSPNYLNPGVVVGCMNIPGTFSQGAVEYDGDSLNFSLIDCYQSVSNMVNYEPSYSGTSPFGSTATVAIDPQTGEITWSGLATGTSMICVLVEELSGGVVTGSTIREIGVIILDCGINSNPLITGLDSTNRYDTTVVAGQAFCFDIHGEDLDANQALFMSWSNTIAGATFVIDSSAKPIGTFCWTPTAQDTGQHTFTVTVNDNGTPIGVTTKTFTINVVSGLGWTNIIQRVNVMDIYPNPTNSNFQIKFREPLNEPISIKIIDVQGTVVLERKNVRENLQEINVKLLPSGIYVVMVITDKGRMIEQQKLIVR